MRTTCVFALVACLMFMTGCAGLKGTGCGGHSGGFCSSGGCDSGGAGFGGGCDSGGCDAGGSAANFSDYNCGPMCGAYLQHGQTSAGCGCDGCEVGQSYLVGQVGSLFGQGQRPIANSLGAVSASVHSSAAALAGRFRSAGGLAGPCRGLGGSVGCSGCGDCGGSAVGTNHSACSTDGGAGGFGGGAGGFGGGVGGPGGGCGPGGCGVGGGIAGRFIRRNGSPHPYGGETPHTASANGFGGGSPAPSFQYPYYTTRGPRDFLMMNPPSIGR